MSQSAPFVTDKYTHDIVTLEQARQWLRMDIPGYEEEDSVIEMAIQSAVSWVEEMCPFTLGVSDWQWNTEFLPCKFKDTFYVKSITSIEYRGDSSYVTINDEDYELIQLDKKISIVDWFVSSYNSSRFRIRFKAGFEDGEVPAILLDAIRARIAERFDNRGDGINEKQTLSEKLLNNFVLSYAG